jgi:hypothetical protein
MGSGFWRSQTEVMIDGRVVARSGTVLDTLRADAVGRVACVASQMTSRWVSLGSPHNPLKAAFVEGCGLRMVYSFEAPYGTNEHLQLYTLSQVPLGHT